MHVVDDVDAFVFSDDGLTFDGWGQLSESTEVQDFDEFSSPSPLHKANNHFGLLVLGGQATNCRLDFLIESLRVRWR